MTQRGTDPAAEKNEKSREHRSLRQCPGQLGPMPTGDTWPNSQPQVRAIVAAGLDPVACLGSPLASIRSKQ
jgi:hypothetical protein